MPCKHTMLHTTSHQRCIRGWWLAALLLLFAAPRAACAPVSLGSLKKLVLLFPLQPLGRPPTPPDAYSKLPVSSWNFTGSSPGFIVVTRHELAPSLVLSELMYFPGTFTPPVCSTGNTRHSTMRFWVDLQVSVAIGRSVWGFPKEIGQFAWSDRGVALTVNGTLVFSANLTGSVNRRYNATPIGTPIGTSSKYSSYTPKDWLAGLVQGGIRTMQFPLKPALKGQAAAADGTAGQSTQAAEEPGPAAAGSLPNKGPPDEQGSSVAPHEAAAAPPTNPAAAFYGSLVPNLQVLRFPGSTGLLNIAASSVFIDPLAFTGGAAVPRLNRARGVGLLLDTPGELGQPVQLAC